MPGSVRLPGRVRDCSADYSSIDPARLRTRQSGKVSRLDNKAGEDLAHQPESPSARRFQARDSARTAMAGAGRAMRMTSFSASTTRKNTSPPRNNHGQTQSGIAAVSNNVWKGGA